jgi:hypothetical protein
VDVFACEAISTIFGSVIYQIVTVIQVLVV